MVPGEKLLRDEKLASVMLRLMIAINDLGITNTHMVEWQNAEDRKKKARWRGGLLYFGRVQSAHLFEALSIVREIRDDPGLLAEVQRCDSETVKSFHTAAGVLGSPDFTLLAKMRNMVSFHYDKVMPVRSLKRLVKKFPNHLTPHSLGSDSLDWYFELGDLVVDDIIIRDIFKIPMAADIQTATIEVLDRLHVIGASFTDFAGHFLRSRCAK
jgi:hypothetical protein